MTTFRYISEVSQINKNSMVDISKDLYSAYKTTILNKNLDTKIKPIVKRIEFLYSDNNFNSRELCNNFITNFYPNETVVKSQFVNQYLMKNTDNVSIFELKSFSSRADLCKIGKESIAYEIKTEFDTFTRLDNQLNDYLQLYEKVYIITTQKQYQKLVSKIPAECGVYVYRLDNTLDYKFSVKKAAQLSAKINPLKQLESLTKQDLYYYFGCKNSNDKNEMIKYIITTFSKNHINSMFKTILKNKYRKNWQFLISNVEDIYEIDYQWFYQNNISPKIIYGH